MRKCQMRARNPGGWDRPKRQSAERTMLMLTSRTGTVIGPNAAGSVHGVRLGSLRFARQSQIRQRVMAGSVNKVILVGNLGKDPEVRRMTSGDPVVNLSVATSETWRDKASGERKEKTEWHRVVIFNENLAKVAEQYLRKGSKVYLEGQLSRPANGPTRTASRNTPPKWCSELPWRTGDAGRPRRRRRRIARAGRRRRSPGGLPARRNGRRNSVLRARPESVIAVADAAFARLA